MNDSLKNMTGDELIDSVKEVDLKIRDHRADDDFEKMLAELNNKNKPKPQTAQSPAPEKSLKEEKPADNNSAPKAVPTMAAAAIPSAPPIAIPERPVRRKSQAGERPSAKRPARKAPSAARGAKPAPAKRPVSEKPAAVKQPEPKAKAEEEQPLIPNLDAVWTNPNLADGGRVTMNIKTELRKEITITVPKERLERMTEKKQQVKKNTATDQNTDIPKRSAAERQAASAAPKKRETAAAAAKKSSKAVSKTDVMRKQFAIVNVIVCMAIFFGVGFFLLVCERESGFIQSENRNLAEKPKFTVQSLLDGSYFQDISTWYTDTIPGREELKPFSNAFTKLFGITLNDVKITGDIAPAVKEELDPDAAKQTEEVKVNTDFSDSGTVTRRKKTETEQLADVPDELDDGEWMGNVVVSGKGENVRAMSAFYGTFDMGRKYADTISQYREDLGSGVNIYTMNMPTSSAYYMPENLADQFTSQHDCITNIGNNLGAVVNVDVYDALDKHKDEYIYSRTDHHWAPLGAYYAAQVFAEKALVDYPELSTYEECRIENFVGTMYAYSNYDEELNQNPDTFIYYKPDNSYTVNYYDSSFSNAQYGGSLFYDYAEGVNCYSAILGTDDVIAEIETDCDNGRTLVIFKDSFGNALVPFLTHSFSKIYVCDFRYFDLNAVDFCFDVGATDVLFAVSISAAHTESHINAIGNIRIQTPEENADLPEEYIPDGDGSTDDTDSADGEDTQW